MFLLRCTNLGCSFLMAQRAEPLSSCCAPNAANGVQNMCSLCTRVAGAASVECRRVLAWCCIGWVLACWVASENINRAEHDKTHVRCRRCCLREQGMYDIERTDMPIGSSCIRASAHIGHFHSASLAYLDTPTSEAALCQSAYLFPLGRHKSDPKATNLSP